MEEPGPWGPGGVPASRLGETTTAALRRVAEGHRSRLLLVRRPGAERRSPADRTLFLARCVRGREQVLTRRCAVEDVAAAAADDAGWVVHEGPVFLVCTHGRKDWCCALRGRPLARAFAEAQPEGTWECSHLGGCRFAANVLSLPTGHAYGRVDAADVEELTAAVARGAVVPRLLRGRCTDAMVVQAADVHARLALGLERADGLVPASGQRLDPAGERWRITFDTVSTTAGTGAGRVDVEVRLGHVASPQRLTCGAVEEQYARTWELVDVRVLGG